MSLIQHTWCYYKKRKFGQMRTEGDDHGKLCFWSYAVTSQETMKLGESPDRYFLVPSEGI